MLARVAICDVVGHGERVSKVSSWLYDSVQAQMNDPDGAAVLSQLNTVAVEHGMKAMTTAAIISYYTGNGGLSFSYAGHPPAWVWTRESGIWQRAEISSHDDGPANLPLGVLDNPHYDQTEMPLQQGDRVVVFSDGILETPGTGGEMFGEGRLQETLNRFAPETPVSEIRRSLVAAAAEHGNGSLSHDDVTLLALEVN